ncbi:MAG: 30S ribosome-binding factor RbfA [Treponema sp.]|nr:30S ribosome-binding factor RbfA [Treponema sp.]
MSEFRIERLNHLIQEKVGSLIVEGKIKDPRVGPFLSITRVDVSRDLSYADLYVSSFESEYRLKKGVVGLQSAAGFIQAQLNLAMHIRQTPKLRFHEDHSLKEGFDIVKKIEDLNAESGQ